MARGARSRPAHPADWIRRSSGSRSWRRRESARPARAKTRGSLDPGWFNYTDYEHSALRMLRIDVSAAVNAGAHVAVLGELWTENLGAVRPYALYARIRPWAKRNVDVNIGRVPPTFGAFARRT